VTIRCTEEQGNLGSLKAEEEAPLIRCDCNGGFVSGTLAGASAGRLIEVGRGAQQQEQLWEKLHLE
jgi:hypothetical protein